MTSARSGRDRRARPPAVVPGGQPKVVPDAQPAEQRPVLGDAAEAPPGVAVRCSGVDRPAEQADLPGERGQQPGHGHERRRLAGPVRAQQGHDLARLDGERQVAHHDRAAVAGVQVRATSRSGVPVLMVRSLRSLTGRRPPGRRLTTRSSPRTSAGVPLAMSRPPSTTCTTSQTSSTRSMSWSISSTAVPAPTTARSRSPSRALSPVSSPAAGSSSSSTAGSVDERPAQAHQLALALRQLGRAAAEQVADPRRRRRPGRAGPRWASGGARPGRAALPTR